eukprot:CAMPEP_0204382912 /NCGR_PEP_ID=MMETSP0469-20131031/55531_1 /ASSEMBLY_ACC=CAM_ASM_000384 /TAXON_ID=2969 /ORGANISM="Oxyrrhis marina" /LENGTH=75 /DNA_ID=CAMNT_0051375115 /DNA_START=131 /DNA_END=358 /DNA_ORIENTATION=-
MSTSALGCCVVCLKGAEGAGPACVLSFAESLEFLSPTSFAGDLAVEVLPFKACALRLRSRREVLQAAANAANKTR